MAAQDFQTLRRGLQAPERPDVVSSAQSHLRLQAPEHIQGFRPSGRRLMSDVLQQLQCEDFGRPDV